MKRNARTTPIAYVGKGEDGPGIDLGYRTKVLPGDVLSIHTLGYLLTISTYATLATVLLRLAGFALLYIPPTLVYVAALAAGAWCALRVLIDVVGVDIRLGMSGLKWMTPSDVRQRVARSLIYLALPSVVLVMAIVVATTIDVPPMGFLTFIAACCGLAFIADHITGHVLEYEVASPVASSEERAHTRSSWGRRAQRLLSRLQLALRKPGSGPRLGVRGELHRYPAGFLGLAICAASSAAVFFLSRERFAQFSGLLAITTYLLASVSVLWLSVSRSPGQLGLALAATTSSIVSWLTFNHHDTKAPGVLRSPGGGQGQRAGSTGLVLLGLTFAVLPTAAFFPVVVVATGPNIWTKYLEKPFFWEDSTSSFEPRLWEYEEEWLSQQSVQERGQLREALLDERRREIQAGRNLWRMSSYPDSWVIAAVRGFLTEGRTVYLLAFVVGAALCILVPPTLMVLSVAMVGGRVILAAKEGAYALAASREMEESAPVAEKDLTPDVLWERQATALLDAAREMGPREAADKDHLFLGYAVEGDHPVLLPRKLLQRHAHILGDTGSGKTSLGLAPLTAQLIRRADSSLLFLDLKGDPALFHGAKAEAERAGIPFKWFTLEPTHSSFAFNPFTQSHMERLTQNQRAQVLLQSLGLEYGQDYGRGFFSSVNENVLRNLLNTYGDQISSFSELQHFARSREHYAKASPRKSEWDQAGALTAVIDRMAGIVPLNVTEHTEHPPEVLRDAIDLPELFERPQVVYFYMQSKMEPVSTHSVAKLALYSLLSGAPLAQAAEGEEAPPERRQVYAVIDEFQEIITKNFARIVQQARSEGIAAILANQDLSDLRNNEANLIATVEANTAFKQVFAAGSQFQRKHLVESSGDAEYISTSKSYSASVKYGKNPGITDSFSISHRETIGPYMTSNDIIDMSTARNACHVRMSEDGGYAQYGGYPFEMWADFHIPFEDYQALKRAPWPNHPSAFTPAHASRTKQRSSRATDSSSNDAPVQHELSFDELVERHRQRQDERSHQALHPPL